ncbi:MFS transporter [Luteimicrobium subarcticum]|uniref:Na+/melibiose symporter-like transporter n=1 Tax=Luteimicrobium subarcticum TaxID=620910 RepID=A0A2M8WUP6_9MICO|nr:MFS transporter [Luteimicrobium subarcticum]PJI94628.1 Na+/melibiose symporter-like transporter [Luteimicrobium subarcticum]
MSAAPVREQDRGAGGADSSAPTGSVPTGTVPTGAEPTNLVPALWIVGFATAWLGVWMAQLTPIQLLLPTQVDDILNLGQDDWKASVTGFGTVSAIAGVLALVAYPLTGAASDRTTSRFGRRRPWIALGTVVFAVSLVLLSLQHTMVGVGVWWSASLVGFCILTAALTATISDQVPAHQRGTVSGWMSAPQALGILLGVGIVTALVLGQVAGYVTVAVALVVLVLPFLLTVPDAPLAPEDAPPWSVRTVLLGLWISPREHPDFAWTLAGRLLVMTGNGFGTALLLYFLRYGLHDDDADDDLLTLSLIYMVFVIVAALVLGRLSDRLGRRKVMVFVCAALQGVAALLLAFAPALSVAMVGAAFLGLGFGAFLSVDQALATQVLPNAADRGKDLGIMNVAYAVPQALAPLVGGWLVVQTGSFMALFLAAGVLAILGALAVIPVKSVR